MIRDLIADKGLRELTATLSLAQHGYRFAAGGTDSRVTWYPSG
jgi:hypothetical protein